MAIKSEHLKRPSWEKTINQQWCSSIIQEFVSQSVSYFCIAPGSRSTPLTLAAENHPETTTCIHFDERGLGFHALGYGKATKKPAVLIVTSGTAVGNLLPSIMEAHHSETPLIVCSADRPFELKDCAANQATEQTYIFSPWVQWQCAFPCPTKNIENSVLQSKIAFACHQAKKGGVVHINFPFREPLFSSDNYTFSSAKPLTYYGAKHTLPTSTFSALSDKVGMHPQSIVLIGSQVDEKQTSSILRFAEKCHFPVIADVFSKPYCKQAIFHHEWIEKPKPQGIFHFGASFVSKSLLEWITQSSPSLYCQISPSNKCLDPTHCVTDRIFCDAFSFCENIQSSFKDSSWLNAWQTLEKTAQKQIDTFFLQEQHITEPAFFYRFIELFPKTEALFIGNSMPIRNANLFLRFTKQIFANRGLSGIDGNISTAYGLAQGLQKPVSAILGDQTFLADLNSLAESKKCIYPVQFFVLNNKGGSIFSHLPVAKSKHFEKYFQDTHSFHFEAIASQFDIPYYRVEDFEELRQDFPKSSLIELITCAKKNSSIYQQLNEISRYAMHS